MSKISEKVKSATEDVKNTLLKQKNNLDKNYSNMTVEEKDKFEYNKKQLDMTFHDNVSVINNRVFKDYLTNISELYTPLQIDQSSIKFSYQSRLRMLKVNKWVVDENESSIDKLKNVYSSLCGYNCSIALVYRRIKECVNIYFILVNQDNKIDPAIVDGIYDMFVSSLKGNFPGTDIEYIENPGSYRQKQEDEPEFGEIDLWFKDSNSNAISMITNISSESSDDFVCQGIEKLINGYVPEDDDHEYTLMLLASPLSNNEINEQNQLFYDMYTSLSPFATWQKSTSLTDAISLTKGASIGASLGASYVISAGVNTNFTSLKTNTTSGTEGVTRTYTDYSIKDTLAKIEGQVKRLQMGKALGMWKFSSYVLADSFSIAENVANIYRSLTQGEKSFVEPAAINIWNDNREEKKHEIDIIQAYLKAFTHPVFVKKNNVGTNNGLPEIVDGCTFISGEEMAMSFNLPTSPVQGLPVFECASFGRNVMYRDNTNSKKESVIDVGCVHHMQHDEKNSKVYLDKDSLTKHVFITGSTGSGKSTTIYRILTELQKQKCKFLVIEPAKGEYKYALGSISKVYGTNPSVTDLLKINPFSFPETISVYEHIDRVIEILNVCWPMYAAMPAVLKEAVEKAYQCAGWNLTKSKNNVDSHIFPTFIDVLSQLKKVIDKSDFSQEVKSNYTGSLVTRVKSLTNGIYSQIFTCDELNYDELFNENVIVDLSRIGSTETKAMLMGILIMKMQEYRMSERESGKIKSDEGLRHITVLEEAHNLLKRVSTEQSTEGSNLLGKSVEMIANAIAEMRTYGEGFIIADQSPGLLDMSVIRNTNTKIIHNLPDISDRELVGKAAGLEDNQIVEIGKLQNGVAAVFQNNWISSVLCHIEKSGIIGSGKFQKHKNKISVSENDFEIVQNIIKNKIDNVDGDALLKMNIESEIKLSLIESKITKMLVSNRIKAELVNHLVSDEMVNITRKYINSVDDNCDKAELNQIVEKFKTAFSESLPVEYNELNEVLIAVIISKYIDEPRNNVEKFNYAVEQVFRGGIA